MLTLMKFEDVSQYVSDIIQDFSRKDLTTIHDVAILPLGHVVRNPILENVIGKISFTNPTMITSFDHVQAQYGYRKPSFIVIVSDLSRAVS